jgi:small GTP-binding protein
VGKSTLLNKLTGTFSEVADYEFTTLTCIPGMIRHNGAKIQLLDLPGIIEGAKDGKGRGRQVISIYHTTYHIMSYSIIKGPRSGCLICPGSSKLLRMAWVAVG